MGAHHTTSFGQHLQAITTGRYYIHVEEPVDRTQVHRVCSLMDRKTAKPLAGMSTQPLPGCCGAILFCHFSGKKVGDIYRLIELGQTAAKRAGFGLVVLTLRNEAKLLPLVGEMDARLVPFLNGKTGNGVTLVALNVPQTPPQARVGNVEGE